jgi:Protein of unknown function (DUF3352)
MNTRLFLAVLASSALITLPVGCSDGSSGADLAELAPPGAPVFVEGLVRPTGELKSNTEAIAEQVAGIPNLGDYVVSKLESSARDDGEPFDFAKEVEPWLGERAGVFFEKLEGEELSGAGAIVESTDVAATRKFIDTQVKASADPYRSASYKGVAYELGGSEGNAIGVVGDSLVIAEGEKVFKEMTDASAGDSLAGEDAFAEAISAASDDSLADVYVDVGELIDQSGGQVDPQARQILRNAGIDPSEATAVASVVPGADQITIEFSSDLGGVEAPTGDAAATLGSLPSNAFAAFGVADFGDQLEEAIDSLDEEGIPGVTPPNQLKAELKELGVDLDALTGSLREAVVYGVGANERSLGGALVLTTSDSQVAKAIANLSQVLNDANAEGVFPLVGLYRGFAVRDPDLGKPLVVAANGQRIAIGYGFPAAMNTILVERDKGKLLAEKLLYREAVASLGDTPIVGFVNGPYALLLAKHEIIPSLDGDFEQAPKYLNSIRFLALGAATQDDGATAKLVIGLR